MSSIRSDLYSYRRLDMRWDSLTTRIKEKSNFSCEICGIQYESKKYIQIHHKYYYEDRDPWDYEDEALQAVCMKCHSEIDHSTITTIKNGDKEEMIIFPFIITNSYISKSTETLKYNKFYNIKLYSRIIDCGYLTMIQGGGGRFDFELAYRELIIGDPAYSQRKNGERKKSSSKLFFPYQEFGDSIYLYRRPF